MEVGESSYKPRQAAYDLLKFRAKGLVERIGQSHRYFVQPDQLQAMAGALVLRDQVFRVLLAGDGKLPLRPRPEQRSEVDDHYHTIRAGLIRLFDALGLTA